MDMRFPIGTTVWAGYSETLRNFGKILKLAWLPFLLAASAASIFDFARFLRTPFSPLPVFGPLFWPIVITSTIVVVCCLGIFALAMFRCRLMGWSNSTNYLPLKIGKRELLFVSVVLFGLALQFFVAQPVIIWAVENLFLFQTASRFELMLAVEDLVEGLVFMFIFARLCYVLADISILPSHSIKITRRVRINDWFSLFVILILTLGVAAIFGNCLRSLTSDGIWPYAATIRWLPFYIDLRTAYLLGDVLELLTSLAISFLGIAVAVTAVSENYKSHVGMRREATK